jgi:hypothetical protein
MRNPGGLCNISISDAANERKRKMLLELVNKRSLLVSALRSSGHCGAGLTGRHLWPSLDKGGVVDSLATNLKDLRLRLRVGDCSVGTPLMAAWHES